MRSEAKSQRAVDGSLASLHCWLDDFEDTQGNTEDSIARHMGGRWRQGKLYHDQRWQSCFMAQTGQKERNGKEWRCQRDEMGIRVGGRTEGQSV